MRRGEWCTLGSTTSCEGTHDGQGQRKRHAVLPSGWNASVPSPPLPSFFSDLPSPPLLFPPFLFPSFILIFPQPLHLSCYLFIKPFPNFSCLCSLSDTIALILHIPNIMRDMLGSELCSLKTPICTSSPPGLCCPLCVAVFLSPGISSAEPLRWECDPGQKRRVRAEHRRREAPGRSGGGRSRKREKETWFSRPRNLRV